MKKFEDRKEAARQLLPHLKKYAGKLDALLIVIPRGALQMGAVLRDELELPLDIVVTKKIGAPDNEEFAIGAVDPEGGVIMNDEVMMHLDIPEGYLDRTVERLQGLIEKRYRDYRGDLPLPVFRGKTVIVVDDGIATGLTTLAAIRYIRKQKPAKLVLAVPVAAHDSAAKLEKEADELICLMRPEDFDAVGQFYKHFPQVEDEEAIRLLQLK
jgi:predicted phosphoribosyltransferase